MTADLFGSEPAPAKGPRVFSVSEVTRAVRMCVEKSVGEVWVQGEVCNHRKQSSGHQYFGLKDERALLTCVLFHKSALRQPPLADGMLVQVRGDMTVYEARGQYQLVVNLVQAAGAGLLQAKFEALKRRLAAEGMFAAERKRALPKFPRALGIVTSPDGAALYDMLNIIKRRAPWMRIVIHPVRVQGTGAAFEIAAAVHEFNTSADLPEVDIIVVARGGGSAEDLWEFNEEILARAIFASRLPVVSAVGHEIDFTMADLVADLRAPTPSAAAELIVPEAGEMGRHLAQLAGRLERALFDCLTKWKTTVASLARTARWHDPRRQLAEWMQRVDAAEAAMTRSAGSALQTRRHCILAARGALRAHRPDQAAKLLRQRLREVTAQFKREVVRQIQNSRRRERRAAGLLQVLSPLATLRRGYSVTLDGRGKIIRSVAEIKARMKLVTRLSDGSIISTAQTPVPSGKSRTPIPE